MGTNLDRKPPPSGPIVRSDRIKLAAARYRLAIATSEYVRDVADAELSRGRYSPALAAIASEVHPALSTVGPLLETALAELDIAMPDEATAVRPVIADRLWLIVEREVPPREGLAALMHDLRDRLWREPGGCAGDALGIAELVGWHYGYDDLENPLSEATVQGLRGPAALALVDKEVARLAQAWLNATAL